MTILGVSAFHHDSAAALIKKGRIIGACHEERFTRKKFDSSWPSHSIDYLHSKTNGIETVVFYDKDNKGDSKALIKSRFPKAEIIYVDHHESHAMSSVLTTNWDECAVMVVDTVGGNYSTSLGVFSKNRIKWIEKSFNQIESKIEKLRLIQSDPRNGDNYEVLNDAMGKMSALENEYLNLMEEHENLKNTFK